ncbi:MAG: hypothetical protein M1831_004517 [Alyxoria varia]|nr:MAG: hypothetical protein M1831_004517 [Alyxoria varia]
MGRLRSTSGRGNAKTPSIALAIGTTNQRENANPKSQSKTSIVAYPKLPRTEPFPDLTTTGSVRSERQKIIRSPSYIQTPINPSPFVRKNGANISRRRANAISLANSPARKGHSQAMARLFHEAQQTVHFQDQYKKKEPSGSSVVGADSVNTENRPVTSTPQPRVNSSKEATESNPKQTEKYSLPAWSPVGSLSEDLPEGWRTDAKTAPQAQVVDNTATRTKIPAVQSPKPFDSEISMNISGRKRHILTPAFTHAGKIPFRPAVYHKRNVPKWPSNVTRSVRRHPIETWLDGVRPGQSEPDGASERSRSSSESTDSSVTLSGPASFQHEKRRSKKHGSAPSSARSNHKQSTSLISPPRRAISSLIAPPVPPARFNANISAPVDENVTSKALPTRFHSTKVPRCIAEKVGKSLGRGGGDSAESQKHEREGMRSYHIPHGHDTLAKSEERKILEDVEVTPERPQNNGEEHLTPLSGKVERFRKGKGPARKARCASYYDDGMSTVPSTDDE